MLRLTTEADIQRLIDDGIEENLSLDYKASDALGKTDGKKREIGKDVSAMANSDGGQIIYGIAEKDREPTRDDPGIDPAVFSKETLEQIIDTNISPRIEGLVIVPITLASGRVVYVVTIPQAISRAPHQASDKHYYVRQNFQSVRMEDYQVKDAMRRSTSPHLFVRFEFEGNAESVTGETEQLHPSLPPAMGFNVYARIYNRSAQPALYAIFRIFIDERLALINPAGLRPPGITYRSGYEFKGRPVQVLERRFSLHVHHFPIFKEAPTLFSEEPFRLTFPYDGRLMLDRYALWYSIQTPGFETTQFVSLVKEGARLYFPEQE